MLQAVRPVMSESNPAPVSDRELIRYLISKYGAKELPHLLQEEGLEGFCPSLEYNSTNLFEAVSLDDAHTPRSLQDFNKNEPRHCTTPPPGLPQLPWSPLNIPRTNPTSASSKSQRRAAMRSLQKPKGQFVCGFCSEEGVKTTCTRKNDLKRHIEGYHHLNAQWICQAPGCDMTFDWEKGYKAHIKSAHSGTTLEPGEAKSILCPQTVFACGFERCLQVFEATGDNGANETFKDYLTHLMKHYDEGPTAGKWTYSARMRNLLRQSLVNDAWGNSSWLSIDPSSRNQLEWTPRNTGILRKILETRHIGEVEQLINYAIDLSHSPKGKSPLQSRFHFPIKGMCVTPVVGHLNSAPQPVPDSQGKQRDQQQPMQLPSPGYYTSSGYSLRADSLANYAPRQTVHIPPTSVSGFVSSPESSYGSLQQSPPTPLFNGSPSSSVCLEWNHGDVDSPIMEGVDRSHNVSFGESFVGGLQSPALTEM